MDREYGGYLPLELDRRKEYYLKNADYEVRKYNSGRCAIYQAVKDSLASRVWLPIYLCDTVSNFLERKNVTVEFYNIDQDFLPVNIELNDEDIVVWTTYFGMASKNKIERIIKKYPHLIIDNTQSFFLPPQKNVYNVYSCRKFFGVPDGSYLISDTFKKSDEKLPKSNSVKTLQYLVDSIESSTNGAYAESLENEERITGEDVMAMSHFTERVLSSVDYGQNQRVRLDNFEVYNSMLGGVNELKFSNPENAPMIYPLLVKSEGLRHELVAKKIYVPQWWKKVIDDSRSNDWERYLSKYLIPLPIDQRYCKEDMEYISGLVLNHVKGY